MSTTFKAVALSVWRSGWWVKISEYSSDTGGPTMVGADRGAKNFENLPL